MKIGRVSPVWVTRRPGEELISDCLVPSFRGFSTVMIWGAINSQGFRRYHIFDKGAINGDTYRATILPIIKELADEYRQESVFACDPIIQ